MKRKFLFSRTYEVLVDVEDDTPEAEEAAESKARSMIIENERHGPDGTVEIGALEFDGTADAEEE